MTVAEALALAVAHQQAGRLAQAEQIYRQILHSQPEQPDALHLLGVIDYTRGRLERGIEQIQRAIAIDSSKPEFYSNLAEALRLTGRLEESLARHRDALALRENYAPAHFGIGLTLRDRGQLDEAIDSLRRALELRPDFFEAQRDLANALRDRGEIGAAIDGYRRALELRPDAHAVHSSLIHALHYDPAATAATIRAEADRWNQLFAPPPQAWQSVRPPDGQRLRIGYVSSDFYHHASAHFLHPLLRSHDRQRFEVFCYADVIRPDAMTEALSRLPEHWRLTTGWEDRRLAEQIRADGIDLLVDLKLHTPRNRLRMFAMKPAPLQLSWLGYPGTTGVTAIDVRLTDAQLDPWRTEGTNYSERCVRLPDSFWCYDPLESSTTVMPTPVIGNGFFTFGCLNDFAKVSEPALSLWAAAMIKIPRSRLHLLVPQGVARQRVERFMAERGVTADRLTMLSRRPRAQYLELYHQMDLSFDTFPYNGHTTSFDSLWMGVPMISRLGSSAVGRAGASFQSVDQRIARSDEQFLLQVELMCDVGRLTSIRSRLRERLQQSPLMDARRFAANVELIYERLHAKSE